MNTLVKRCKKMKNRKGFTLVELIVVIVIIGILAAILIPRMTGFTDKANATEALVHAKQVATAYDSLYAENNNSWTGITESQIRDLAKIPTSTTISATAGAFTVTADNGKKAGRTGPDTEVIKQ